MLVFLKTLTKKKIALIVLGLIAVLGLIYLLLPKKDEEGLSQTENQEDSGSKNKAETAQEKSQALNLSQGTVSTGEQVSSQSQDPTLSVTYEPERANPISGTVCPNPLDKNRRPIAVMLASDKKARPLYGTSQAEMVYEMPVITNMITRLMAVFVCRFPAEIGSIRSARHDYFTLARGNDAILAHWGGSHFALEMLKDYKPVDNLNALSNPGGAFYRKSGLVAPHNGFASYAKLWEAAQALGYSLENRAEGNKFRSESPFEERGSKGGKLTVGFPGSNRVEYQYDQKTNRYLRTWGGKADIDGNTNQQVAPKNVVVIFAVSRQIEGQYNDVDIEGEGKMLAYLEGREFSGKWVKEKGDCVVGNDLVCVNSKRLKFIKDNGQELEFVPGQIWVEVLEPGQVLRWEPVR